MGIAVVGLMTDAMIFYSHGSRRLTDALARVDGRKLTKVAHLDLAAR